MIRRIVVATLFAVLVSLTACGPSQDQAAGSALVMAQRIGSPDIRGQQLCRIVDQYPRTPAASSAQLQVKQEADVAWNEAQSKSDYDLFDRFTHNYPCDPRVAEAKTRFDDLFWQFLAAQNRPSSFMEYVRLATPTSRHVDEARQRLKDTLPQARQTNDVTSAFAAGLREAGAPPTPSASDLLSSCGAPPRQLNGDFTIENNATRDEQFSRLFDHGRLDRCVVRVGIASKIGLFTIFVTASTASPNPPGLIYSAIDVISAVGKAKWSAFYYDGVWYYDTAK